MQTKQLIQVQLVLILALGLVACAEKPKHSGAAGSDVTAGVDPSTLSEVSLKSDRSALEEARKDLPDEVKRENDEVAGLLSFIVRESEEDPSKLRDRFSSALRKKRERMDREFRKRRETFTSGEKTKREQFLKELKDDRDDFVGRRRTPEERKRFFDKQDGSRREYFADESDRRKEFESNVQEQRKELEDYIREKQNAFNQEWRAYQTRYTERKRALDLKAQTQLKAQQKSQLKSSDSLKQGGDDLKAAPQATQGPALSPAKLDPKAALDEFEQIPPGPGIPLMDSKGP